MQGDNGFFSPVQYGPAWALIGLLLFTVIVAWFIAVPLLTRSSAVWIWLIRPGATLGGASSSSSISSSRRSIEDVS